MSAAAAIAPFGDPLLMAGFLSIAAVAPDAPGQVRMLARAGAGVVGASVLIAWALQHGLLEPAGLGYLRTLVLLFVAAGLAQAAALLLQAHAPLEARALGARFVPLLAAGALLAPALRSAGGGEGFVPALAGALGAGFAFAVVVSTFGALRERVALADVPVPLRGVPIALVTAGLFALAILGLQGLGGR